MSFLPLGLSSALLEILGKEGIVDATPIQAAAIPAVLRNKDLLGIAPTGSGKTASYVLPIVQGATTWEASKYREPVVLVMVPTRELALQVDAVFKTYLPAARGQSSLAVFGGASVNSQMQEIGKVSILIATPGRLLELVEKNAVRLSAVQTLVLDEADKMLSLGFKDEVDRILQLLPPRRQNLLFSATFSDDLGASHKRWLRDPQVIRVDSERVEIDLIRQSGYFVSEEKKGPLLRYLIKRSTYQQILVFASSTAKVDGIVHKLFKNGIHAAAMHSKLSQQMRRDALQQFKNGKLPVLVATDLLARGIDIEFLPCVINYELPRSPKDYIHRIGRTGRAESPGDAISLVSPEESAHFRVIQKKTGKQVPMIDGNHLDLHGY
jgi:ATP-dependent RNA helicase RhlE